MVRIATLTLTKVWLNRLDSGEAISAQSDNDRRQGYNTDGEVRTYAGGRQRAVSAVGEQGTFTFTLVQVSLATVTALRTWAAVPVQVRDHRGQRWLGVFFEVPIGEDKNPALYSVTIALKVITVDEDG